jgi:hypothetical protein
VWPLVCTVEPTPPREWHASPAGCSPPRALTLSLTVATRVSAGVRRKPEHVLSAVLARRGLHLRHQPRQSPLRSSSSAPTATSRWAPTSSTASSTTARLRPCRREGDVACALAAAGAAGGGVPAHPTLRRGRTHRARAHRARARTGPYDRGRAIGPAGVRLGVCAHITLVPPASVHAPLYLGARMGMRTSPFVRSRAGGPCVVPSAAVAVLRSFDSTCIHLLY